MNAVLRKSLALAAAWALSSSALVYGQAPGNSGVGVPFDWSHHHVIFSNPGTAQDAIRKGQLARWNKINADRRFLFQQLRQDLLQKQLAAAPDYAGKLSILQLWDALLEGRKPSKPSGNNKPLKTDWSMNLGSGASVGAGQYPAKFTFDSTTANCSDWVAYNTGIPGVSGGQPNIVAYTNIYETTCGTTTPTVNWAYFTGTGKALTSTVLSLDGTKIAYVENTTAGAILRILQWHAGQGTPAAAATPNNTYTNTTAGAVGNKAWNATNCPTAGSCLIKIGRASCRERVWR